MRHLTVGTSREWLGSSVGPLKDLGEVEAEMVNELIFKPCHGTVMGGMTLSCTAVCQWCNSRKVSLKK